jgi:hypothetical protein
MAPVSTAEWWKEATTNLTMAFQWCLITGAPSAWQLRAASRARRHLVYYKNYLAYVLKRLDLIYYSASH